jgi:hypothetical protein
MGQYFKVVNIDKRQYFCPSIFNDEIKKGAIMRGIHPKVLGWLIRLDDKTSKGVDFGSWAGDRIAIVGDESGSEFFGLDTKPEYHILNDLVVDQFENIGAKLFLKFSDLDDFCELIVDEILKESRYLGKVAYVIYQYPDKMKKLTDYLNKHLGEQWKKEANALWNDKNNTFIAPHI